MRLVLDTNVVASALLWGGRPAQVLRLRYERRVRLFTSMQLLTELAEILGRPKFERKISASQLSIDQLLERYAALTDVVRPDDVGRIAPDPDDDVLIGTALAARADVIVTGDQGLLTVRAFRGVRLQTVADVLGAIEAARQ